MTNNRNNRGGAQTPGPTSDMHIDVILESIKSLKSEDSEKKSMLGVPDKYILPIVAAMVLTFIFKDTPATIKSLEAQVAQLKTLEKLPEQMKSLEAAINSININYTVQGNQLNRVSSDMEKLNKGLLDLTTDVKTNSEKIRAVDEKYNNRLQSLQKPNP